MLSLSLSLLHAGWPEAKNSDMKETNPHLLRALENQKTRCGSRKGGMQGLDEVLGAGSSPTSVWLDQQWLLHGWLSPEAPQSLLLIQEHKACPGSAARSDLAIPDLIVGSREGLEPAALPVLCGSGSLP